MNKILRQRFCTMCYRIREALSRHHNLGDIVWILQALLLYFIIIKDWLIGIINVPETNSALKAVIPLLGRYIRMWRSVDISRSFSIQPSFSQWLLH